MPSRWHPPGLGVCRELEGDEGEILGIGFAPKYIERRNLIRQEEVRFGRDDLVEIGAVHNTMIDCVDTVKFEDVRDKIWL